MFYAEIITRFNTIVVASSSPSSLFDWGFDLTLTRWSRSAKLGLFYAAPGYSVIVFRWVTVCGRVSRLGMYQPSRSTQPSTLRGTVISNNNKWRTGSLYRHDCGWSRLALASSKGLYSNGTERGAEGAVRLQAAIRRSGKMRVTSGHQASHDF